MSKKKVCTGLKPRNDVMLMHTLIYYTNTSFDCNSYEMSFLITTSKMSNEHSPHKLISTNNWYLTDMDGKTGINKHTTG